MTLPEPTPDDLIVPADLFGRSWRIAPVYTGVILQDPAASAEVQP
jgi:hypothetical protein